MPEKFQWVIALVAVVRPRGRDILVGLVAMLVTLGVVSPDAAPSLVAALAALFGL